MKLFRYALQGLLTAIRTEPNMRFHIPVAVLVIAAGIWFNISINEWLAVIICIALVISFELMNTSLEQLCNMVMPLQHPGIKMIKDMAAAAVLVVSIASAVIGIIIFYPRILLLF